MVSEININAQSAAKQSIFSSFLQNNNFALQRIALFEKIQLQNKEKLLSKTAPIKIEFLGKGEIGPKTLKGMSGKTTPHSIALELEGEIPKSAVIAKVNGVLFDLHRPLEENCTLEFFDFGSKEGNHVFWHSSAHALGECLEILYEAKLTIGPALENSFYYDADLGEKKISQKNYSDIEKALKKVVSGRQRFERVVLTKTEALEMFKDNPFKIQLINENIENDAVCTAYRCGPLIDLCRGPHIPSTGYIKAFKILKNSGCYWKGDSSNIQLQRIYGVSFPNKKQLRERLKQLELAKERDHRKIGKEQNLFFFHPLSPGSCFWLPKGTIIYNKLIELMRSEYIKKGYKEVICPNIYNMELWETSGHAAKYKENMFCFSIENKEFAMKSMNCPGHCLIFKQKKVSYRELPIRYADFGVLHRNELTGTLTGLSRVRRFQQDDAHIFCSVDMISQEVKNCLAFVREIYAIFSFSFTLVLSTRPEKYIGDLEVWRKAEDALKSSLEDFGKEWSLNEGDGAFYGPKIDVLLHDALGRSIQCATIQLDFNLPSENRFDLKFTNKEGQPEQPVIVHRAILGSVERFTSILTEHYGGKWPFWISPRQIAVIPLSDKYFEFAEEICASFKSRGYEVDCDHSDNKVEKKVREAQISQYNIILVLGNKEKETGIFSVRFRDDKTLKKKTMEELLTLMDRLVSERSDK